jgi:hypothetical protein
VINVKGKGELPVWFGHGRKQPGYVVAAILGMTGYKALWLAERGTRRVMWLASPENDILTV